MLGSAAWSAFRRMKQIAVCLGVLVLAACARPVEPLRYHLVTETRAPLDTDATDIEILNRVSWGANAAGAQMLRVDGLKRYLHRQLHPSDDDGLPPQVQAQIAAMEISGKSLAELDDSLKDLRQAVQRAKGTPEVEAARKTYQERLNRLAREAAARSLLRDLYSRNQLKEQLVWFWMNHFNVSQNKGEIRALVGDYEERAIRPHALGKFRDLLAATAFHPAMLQYLDNAQNAAGHINENYAREIMELHTMGVGSGYSQSDVQELARIFTGLSIDRGAKGRGVEHVGDFTVFRAKRHDTGDKHLLGTTIHGTGLDEINQALTLLARQPATAHFISTKLAEYFCGDHPPESVIAAMAKTFQASDGNIADVLETLFAAPEFTASLGQSFKDPMHYAISALRLSYGDTVILNLQPLNGWLDRSGEPLYRHETPDGYPLSETEWSGPGQMETRFEIARAIASGHNGLFRTPDEPKEPAAPPDIAKSRFYTAIQTRLRPATVQALNEAKSPVEWNTLFLSSPDFMRR
jgi:uncharacterized protein (DUF1800 family)